MKFFQAAVAVLFLIPETATAAKGIENERAITQRPASVLIIDLPRSSGAPIALRRGIRLSIGEAREPWRPNEPMWEASPGSRSFPAELKDEVKHFTSVERGGFQGSLLTSLKNPGLRLRYAPDSNRLIRYEFEIKKDGDGGTRGWITWKMTFF